MKSLCERCQAFRPIKYTRVIRDGESYSLTEKFTYRVLRICAWTYKRLPEANQLAQLIRKLIDTTVRAYQDYSIKEKFGGHYREVGLNLTDKVEFEHVVPLAIARDMLLHDFMTIEELMNIPTCVVLKKNHKKLNSKKLAKTTPNVYKFWERYEILNIQIETHRGDKVDMSTWDLDQHYSYFKTKK